MKITLFSSQTGSAVSPACILAADEDHPGLEREVSLVVRSANWNDAAVTVEVSHDYTDSPANWVPAKVVASDGTAATATLSASGNIAIKVPFGVAFRLRNTDTGSPQTTLSASASGPIVSA